MIAARPKFNGRLVAAIADEIAGRDKQWTCFAHENAREALAP
jgi:hypothetical protein